ncbi:DUF4395 domain-containing protein [Runella sp. SP2]|uniref:DUF4395 domain-containing protein n=1 Tax=Runella sp. SP2 TaxID=2268026 RepID=UPI000F08997C|nr:DUF4395 domain-containing protein [Runella sp. SP2]AYQ32906.1 DUF4395 domain-containing protein [Runella sp. SP2]
MSEIKHIAQINEYKVRTIAFLVLVLAVSYLITGWLLLPILLVIDFGLRAFDAGKYSPLARLSDIIVKQFSFPTKPIYFPPKRFAARIGFAFSVTITVLHLLGIATIWVAGILTFFAALESLAGICAGCYVYDWLLPVWRKIGLE